MSFKLQHCKWCFLLECQHDSLLQNTYRIISIQTDPNSCFAMKIAFPAVHCFLSLLLDIFSFNKPKIAHMKHCLYTGWCVLLKMPFCKVRDGLGSRVLHSSLLHQAAPVHIAGHSRSMSVPLEKLHLCSSPSQPPPHGPWAACKQPLPVAWRAANQLWRESKVSRREADGCAAAGSWGHGERLGPGLSQVGSEPPCLSAAEEGWRDVKAEFYLPVHTTE